MMPEGRRKSPATRESLARCTSMMYLERERMKEIWCRMEKEQTEFLDTRDGILMLAAPTLQRYSDTRMTKLISTGGPMTLCYQLYTEGSVATWKQAAVPNYGHSGVLGMPVKCMPQPDQVDPAAMAWQTAPASSRRVGTTEVVLRRVTRERDGRTRELILFTDRATGKQTVRFRFQRGARSSLPEMRVWLSSLQGQEPAEESSHLELIKPGRQRSQRHQGGKTRPSRDRQDLRKA